MLLQRELTSWQKRGKNRNVYLLIIFYYSLFRQRKSVIVSFHKPSRLGQEDFNNTQGKPNNFKLDIDCSILKTLCSTYFVQEDSFYMEKLKDRFEETRSEISLGQEIVTEFIQFCQVREEFSPAFWQGVSRQMRWEI